MNLGHAWVNLFGLVFALVILVDRLGENHDG
jgi:hypothetical protein